MASDEKHSRKSVFGPELLVVGSFGVGVAVGLALGKLSAEDVSKMLEAAGEAAKRSRAKKAGGGQ